MAEAQFKKERIKKKKRQREDMIGKKERRRRRRQEREQSVFPTEKVRKKTVDVVEEFSARNCIFVKSSVMISLAPEKKELSKFLCPFKEVTYYFHYTIFL